MALQARTEFAAALNQIASEKGVDVSVIVDAIEQAALAAYRKDLTLRNETIPEDFDDLKATINPASGEISILRGEENITPPGFARIAAQTAKQVIAQRLHEAEKLGIMEEYEQKVGTVISGSIQRQEGNTFFIDLGRTEGVMPPSEQTRGEYYAPNQRMKFLIKEIRESGRGPEVIVSRSDATLIKGLFATEVPEIQSGAVEIKAIAREAGGRTKLAAISTQEGVDPVGSLVGQKGVRVQAVINEIGEEKVDIVSYSDDPARFIAAALSPAKDVMVELNEEEKVATVKIPEAQLSLAIGKGGQNVRLAAKLTGWKIDIEGTGEQAESEEVGTHEKEKQVSEDGQPPAAASAQPSDDQSAQDDAAKAQTEKKIEENIDEATAAESVDGATEPEPTPEEAAPAAADAENDSESDPEMKKKEGGDLIGDDEPSEAETAPAVEAGQPNEIVTDDTDHAKAKND